jgi:acetyltransferase AlgX (SGNH hydrolase-like protein)
MKDDMRWWGLWLIMALLSVGAARVSGVSYNRVQNNAEVSVPAFEPGRILDQSFYREVDRYLEDTLSIRGLGLRAKMAVDWELFGDSTSTQVVAGADGWLYLEEYLDPDCADIRAAAGYASLAEDTDEFAVLIARPKAAFHPEPLSSFGAADACVAGARREVDRVLGDRSVDVDTALAEMAAAGADTFLRDDTHWSTAARLVIAEAIVERFSPGLWDDDAVAEAQVPRLAVLRRFIGQQVGGDMPGHVVERQVEFDEQVLGELFAEPLLLEQTSRSLEPDVIPGVTYIVGDSQMAFVVPLIDSYFEELYFVNWLTIELGADDLGALPDPDRVLVETIESAARTRLADPVLPAILERLP